jgi:hypothetical protein
MKKEVRLALISPVGRVLTRRMLLSKGYEPVFSNVETHPAG